ncbi:Pro-kumamolisin, activation domain-containing protein [Mycena latifolia]|nr:Pro-kumamolisin, activation domain-containing protein [Mycena latifolia]
MAFSTLLILLFTAAATSASMVLHERRATAPSGFVGHGAAPLERILTLRVGLASNNLVGLEEKLSSLSTPAPASPEFRRWLSMEEVRAFVQPSRTTRAAFDAFASAHSLNSTVIEPNTDWLSLSLPVAQANELFAAHFEVFAHPSVPRTIARTLTLSLRSASPNHSIPSCDSVTDNGLVTPACLQALYGIPATPATQRSNSLLVTGYVGRFAQAADLMDFLTLLRPDIPHDTTFSLLTTDGGINPQTPGEAGNEANLDVQYATGLATNVPIQFLSVGEDDFATALLDTTTFLDGVANPPAVMTTSYGAIESSFGASMATSGGFSDNSTGCQTSAFVPVFPASCH